MTFEPNIEYAEICSLCGSPHIQLDTDSGTAAPMWKCLGCGNVMVPHYRTNYHLSQEKQID